MLYKDGLARRNQMDPLSSIPRICWRFDPALCLPKNDSLYQYAVSSPVDMVGYLWVSTIAVIVGTEREREVHARILGVEPPVAVNGSIPHSYFEALDAKYSRQARITAVLSNM